jgi:alpha-L-fucosidase
MNYEATLKSVSRHQAPAWYHDAKFGIFIHWGLYSIPAYAPIGRGDINRIMREEGYGSFFTNMPYAEWYGNSIRIEGSPAWRHHEETYGKGFPYSSFAPEFKKASAAWKPEQWADLFRAAGAKYVILVAKHMDGFLMWPSRTPNYAIPGYGMDRDVVGELSHTVKARSMKMGLYYSSALDQSFTKKPMADVTGLLSEGGPIDKRYAHYQSDHWHELIDRYDPSILWGDIAYPPGTNLFELFAYYYNRNPEGAVNDRWGQLPPWMHALIRTKPGRAFLNAYSMKMLKQGNTGNIQPPHYDYRTPEFAVMKDIVPGKWETCRGMGLGFAYNREEKDDDYIKPPELIRMLADIVSKNGNLLLNVGPMVDGTIPPVQENILRTIGAWLATYGEAVYGTRPWVRAEGTTSSGIPLRFTCKSSEEGEMLFVFFMDRLQNHEVVLKGISVRIGKIVRDLATGQALEYSQDGPDLALTFAGELPGSPVHVISISPG